MEIFFSIERVIRQEGSVRSFSISLVIPGLKYPPGATRRQLQDPGD